MKKSYFTLGFLFLIVNLYSQTTYVPDDNFVQSLINLGYDTGALDDYVPTANVNKVAYLDISRKNISDLTGIKDFINLQILICSDNLLSNLNVT
jgi:Leucine-rich repeat (LRR) protein